MEENKIAKGLDTVIDVLGSSGKGLIGAPFKFVKMAKNIGKGIGSGLRSNQKALDLAQQKKFKQQQQLNAQKQKMLLQKQKELAKQQKAKDKLSSHAQKTLNKLGFGDTNELTAKNHQLDVGGLMQKQKAQNKNEIQKGLALPLATPNDKLQSVALKQNQLNASRKQKMLNNVQNKPRNVGGLAFNNPNTLQKPKALDVGQKVGNFKVKQNKEMAKGLSNPVANPNKGNNTETKIKKVMGLN